MAYHELAHRIRHMGSSHKRRNQGHRQVTPTTNAAGQTTGMVVSPPMTGGAASPGGVPMEMPLAMVNVYPAPGGYVTVAYQDLAPIFTSDGAAVPAVTPGRWGQLAAAGSPRDGSRKRWSSTPAPTASSTANARQ
jgi:hypothetical protein